jgi:hypothetical protein
MTIFRPPTDDLVRYSDFAGQGIAHRLFRFYRPEPRGRNVYLMNDGSFSEADLVDSSSYTKIYFGGSENIVTAQEVAALTAAGYGEYLS